MKTKIFLLTILLLTSAKCYSQYITEFNKESPSGHMLRYSITSDSTVSVKKGYLNISGNLIIPDTVSFNNNVYKVTSTEWFAFQSLSELNSVVLPNSLKVVNDYCFKECTSLTSVTLGDSIEIIGSEAFRGCRSLYSINLPSTLAEIRSGAFMDCHSIDTIVWPASIDYIGYHMFCRDSSLSCIVLPNTLRTIDICAFESCTSLHSINIPNAVDSIGESAFIHSGIHTIRIPDSVRVIEHFTFRWCIDLDSVILGESVRIIEGEAFENCNNLRYIAMNDSLKTISSYAFSDCDSIAYLNIPSTVSYIGDGAFYGCDNLSLVSFNADSCIRVGWEGDSPFGGCTNLSSVIIGDNVRFLPSNTFKNCNALQEIEVKPTTPPTLGENVFTGIHNNAIFYIPCNTYSQYITRWGNLNYQEPMVDFNIVITTNNNNMGLVETMSPINCIDSSITIKAIPNNGYHFDHWSTGATSNPYTLVVSSDTIITAFFIFNNGTEGIEDNNKDDINIYFHNGRIVVEGTTDEVRVFDMEGRNVRNEALPIGVYVVKIGERPARKVLVMQ